LQAGRFDKPLQCGEFPVWVILDRVSWSRLPLDVRFDLKATKLARRRNTSRRANFGSDPISFDNLIGPSTDRFGWRRTARTYCGPYSTSRIVIAGLLAKKLCGISVKPNQWVGITGQSSIRGMWWNPTVYQATMSRLAIGRSRAVQAP